MTHDMLGTRTTGGSMQRTWRTLLLAVLLMGFLAPSAWAGVKVKLQLFVDGLIHPLEMLTAPDGTKRRFIVEQSGTIELLLPDGTMRPAPFLDLTEKMVRLNREFDERGLLGMAFHPKFKEIGKSQDLKSPLGKILRIDVNAGDPYNIPADNPFVNQQDALPEIYAYGLRNPWRMAFDAGGEHQLFTADVGQNSYEEVDIIVKG